MPDDQTPAGRIRLGPAASVSEQDVRFEFVSSTGPGGQHVNKRATKARLRVRVGAITLPRGAATRLRRLAGAQLNEDDEIVIAADETRSQHRNRAAALERLAMLVARACVAPKPRKKTKPSRGAVERRLQAKRERGETKARRQRRFREPGDG
ncbi:MAG: alternative ribosome rescue aminoacyl-tRNA hydrolase ArfB [Phycisphaerales bacterium]